MEHARADANYAILTKLVKLQDEKKHVRIYLRVQIEGFEQTFMKFIGSSDVWCLDLYLINIFTKSTKAKRCTDIAFKLKLYFLSVIVEDLNL